MVPGGTAAVRSVCRHVSLPGQGQKHALDEQIGGSIRVREWHGVQTNLKIMMSSGKILVIAFNGD